MTTADRTFLFECQGDRLVAVLSAPAAPGPRGVLLVVGGPQYRAGSHRQFTLLARDLAQGGVAVMRFDYRGMGDSEGELRTFEHVRDDLASAIDAFRREQPEVRDIVIWGLCDAASAGMMYAVSDPRVTGLVLLNPWVRTEQGIAQTMLRHYYWRRLRSPELWRKIAGGAFNPLASLRDFGRLVASVRRGPQRDTAAAATVDGAAQAAVRPTVGAAPGAPDLPQRMRDALLKFRGPALVILSGNDFTAREFVGVVAADAGWQRLLAQQRVSRRDLSEADHTFSRAAWRDQVAQWTLTWLRSW